MVRILAVALSVLALPALAAKPSDSLAPGKAELRSAGELAFGPDGVLFVGDTRSGAVLALDTADREKRAALPKLEIAGLNDKVAARLGTTLDQVSINDVAVNPISHRVYLSVSRGRGADATPVVMRIDDKGGLEEISLENIPHARVALPNAPADAADARGRNPRVDAITDLAYLDGKLWIAGLSNEEFSSKLRAVAYPFQDADAGTSVEIYHGSHGRFETNSPVRSFVPYSIAGEAHILAAYTCTPLVKVPVSALQPGQKVQGTTIAELGNRNRPLDMIVYGKGGKDFILMSNSSRGVMKMATDKIGEQAAITSRTDIAGLPFETLADVKGVLQLDRYDAERALVLVAADGGSADLKTIALP
jgi:hypothetical protein